MTSSSNLWRRSSKQAGTRQAAPIVLGVDAICNIDDSEDQRGVLVKELCRSTTCNRTSNAPGRWCGSLRHEACGRRWTSSSQTRHLPVLRLQKDCIREVTTSRSVCRGRMCQVLCSSSKGKRSHSPGGLHKRRHNIMSYTAHSPSTCLWGLRSGKFKAFEKVMGDVSREWEGCVCGPLTEIERRFDDARSRLRDLTSSTVLQGFNCSSFGELLPHESLVLHMVQRQKRLVNELRVKVASERKLAALCALGGKNVNKRLPTALRNAEGHPVEDQSRWRSLIHEHFGKNSVVTMCKILRPRD